MGMPSAVRLAFFACAGLSLASSDHLAAGTDSIHDADPAASQALAKSVAPAAATSLACWTEELPQGPLGKDMLGAYIDKAMAAAEQRRRAELATLRTPEEWRKRQAAVRARLEQFLGSYGPQCPLNARVVGKLDRQDYVIEKLIFESQPRYYCTANVYIPKRRVFPLPGVLFTCGHSAQGKAYHLYHECCLGLVLKGYVVLALDPTGQGERAEYFDAGTGKPLVPLCVSHHHYLGRPSWLVGRSLAGYRTWDATRAIDYLVSRREVDPERIAVVGNSGGGIMALLITAVDERVKVCAAAHPGGSMEQTFLTGRRIPQAEILSLIPPRPCLFVVGRDSGEEGGHRAKMEDMLLFYRGLAADTDRCQMALVDGVHNMEKPKREPCYAWLNKWFGRQQEGSQEPDLAVETVEALRCTQTGVAIRELRGEFGWTLNAQVARRLRPPRPAPGDRAALDRQRGDLRAAVACRIGWKLPADRQPPGAINRGSAARRGVQVTQLLLESEEGILLPSLLLRPADEKPGSPLILSVSDAGKPAALDQPSLALELAANGLTVLAVDVRGSGETDPRTRDRLPPVTQYDASQFRLDTLAVESAQLGTTLLALQAFDLVRAADYAQSRQDLAGRSMVFVGEGLGGVWALAAAAFDARAGGVVCVGTVPSYRLIVESPYYAVRDYFWVNGALRDFDLPDLVGLVAPRPALVINPVDPLLQPLDEERCRNLLRWPESVFQVLGSPSNLRVTRTSDLGPQAVARELAGGLAGLFAERRP